ncbi:DNA topoisomerase VI, B subunit [Nitzschia inconspicua]|uniref:DNA topoisomerase VI, B subunit n=1 Tax=Nitzschia inconspicua TaxID=303405 RepID=A0A9K3PDZ8_9STRA|nr:DNA topoisomerase VI, B subunit [Nitzschia inconspicua]
MVGSSKKTSKGSTSGRSGGGGGGEVQVQKSPAEFFADNQAIAGFDNLGKSLYTSIRELMENSLDACESIGELPTIQVEMEELSQKEFNQLQGISGAAPKDVELFRDTNTANGGSAKKKKGGAKASNTKTTEETTIAAADAVQPPSRKKASQEGYFKIKVKDNGCGMKHEKIPDLLGRVLSGSKYGVRQTRGKFGLGAKMALIWSKKSTGVPIKVTSAHRPTANSPNPPKMVSTCVLDIDITNNCPRIREHKKTANTTGWIGTEMEILIAGNWTTYKSRVVQYLQQLAIITPYAQLELTYQNRSDPKRNLSLKYDRRSEQMPPLPREIKHHPSSVNNIIVHQLIERSNHNTMIQFLTNELSSVTPSLAKRIVKECGWDKGGKKKKPDEDDEEDDDDSECDTSLKPSELTDRHITKLVQVLRNVQMFKAPDGSCLSPLGEYNLNLGIRKVLNPEFVATARDKPSAYEGHPFVVEAAVSLGGKDAKEGLNIFRYANRIPLLFEAGADVSTRVATNKIKWSSYKMDHKRDKIGVFVSIVSTKIPYKGTGKEYIGDDITEISVSVKRALQQCCQQLRTHLQKRNALRDQKERKSKLSKYIPDVSRSLFDLLEGMRKRRLELDGEGSANAIASSPRKRPRIETTHPTYQREQQQFQSITEKLDRGELSVSSIRKNLEEAVNLQNDIEEQEEAKKSKSKQGIPLFLKPLFAFDNADHDIEHPLFTFRPMRPVSP